MLRAIIIFCLALAFSTPVQADLRKECEQTNDRNLSIAACTEIIKSNSKVPWAFVARGMAYLGNKDPNQALVDGNAALKLDPKLGTAWRLKGLASRDKGDSTLAISSLSRAITLSLNPAQTYLDRAGVYLKSADTDKAFNDYDRAIKLDPKNPTPYIERGQARLENDEPNKAISDFDEVTKLAPGLALGFELLSRAYYNVGKPIEALPEANRALELQPDHAPALELRGKILQTLNRYSEANVDLQRAISLDDKLESAKQLARWLHLSSPKRMSGPCTDAIKTVRPKPTLTIEVLSDAAVVGSALQVNWSITNLEGSASQPSYLMVLVPNSSRFEGTGFFALSPHADNPYGILYGSDHLRAVAPLHTSLSRLNGTITLLPFTAGMIELEWAIVGADACGSWEVGGSKTALFVGAGAPAIDLRDEFSIDRPMNTLQAVNSPYAIDIFPERIEVIDTSSGTLSLKRNGTKPVFSPTGRFLVLKAPVAETYEIFDLPARRLIGRYRSVAGIYWSHSDSFLYIDSSRASGLKIVRALHGRRFEPSSNPPVEGYSLEDSSGSNRPLFSGLDLDPWNGSSGLYVEGHSNWSFELSIERGIVAFRPGQFEGAEDATAAENADIIIHDLTGAYPPTTYRGSPISQAVILAGHGGEPLAIDGWNAGSPLFLSNISDVDPTYASMTEVIDKIRPIILSTQNQLPTGTTVKQRPSERIVHRRSLVARDPLKNPPISALKVVAAKLNHLSSASVQALRAGRDNRALKVVEREILPLYPSSKFEAHTLYGTAPFPDPSLVKNSEKLTAINLADPGRDLWRWKIDRTTYWLTQTVASNRNVHWYNFSMLSSEPGQKPRYADINKNATEFFKVHNTATSDDLFAMYELGDTRTENASAFTGFSLINISGDRFLTMITRPVPTLLAFDLSSWKVVCAIQNLYEAAYAVKSIMHADGQHVTQINSDGALHVYSCRTGERVLVGAYLDDEVIVMDRFGYFDGSEDAASYVETVVPGLPGRHLLSQFIGKLRYPDLAERVLRDQGPTVSPQLTAPPMGEFVRSNSQGDLVFNAYASPGLSYLQLYADGRPIVRKDVNEIQGSLLLHASQTSSYSRLSAIAVDSNGLVSAPASALGGRDPKSKSGRLFAIAVGIDKFPALKSNLKYASADARRIIGAVSHSVQYTEVRSKLLIQEAASESAIKSTLATIVAEGTEADTILIFFAGHGMIDQKGGLRIALSSTSLLSLEATALSFDDIAKSLQMAKSRVIVLLDVCHSGVSDYTSVAANDDAVLRLNTSSGASMIILSASKGQQFSLESEASKGGLFSLAISDFLNTVSRRSPPNNVVSLDDLYRATKAYVVRESGGKQTPWLSRNQVFGDLNLF